jgi:hypothetical protein
MAIETFKVFSGASDIADLPESHEEGEKKGFSFSQDTNDSLALLGRLFRDRIWGHDGKSQTVSFGIPSGLTGPRYGFRPRLGIGRRGHADRTGEELDRMGHLQWDRENRSTVVLLSTNFSARANTTLVSPPRGVIRAPTLVSVNPLDKRVYRAILHIHNPRALFRAR